MGEAIIWWITLEVLGLIALPVCAVALRSLPDRGYTISKTLGLLLTGWIAYTLSMMQLAAFGRGLMAIAALLVAAFSGWLLFRRGGALLAELKSLLRDRANLRYIIGTEILFTLMFGLWALLRAYSPDIFGTEKFMDFGFMNAIVKSPTFPPNDPWLAGYPINYYYFGYVLMAGLTLLSGVPTEIGYNLANATIPALTGMGAFGVTANLIRATLANRADEYRVQEPVHATIAPRRRTRSAAVVAARPEVPVRRTQRSGAGTTSTAVKSATVVAEPVAEILPSSAVEAQSSSTNGHINGLVDGERVNIDNSTLPPAVEPLDFEERPGRQTPWLLSPYLFALAAALMIVAMGHLTTLFAVKQVDQASIQEGNGWRFCLMCQKPETFNWWDPSRLIKDYRTISAPGQPVTKQVDPVDAINEFPAFSFLLADLHPHVMALPLWFLAITMAFALARRKVHRARSARDGLPGNMASWLVLLLAGLVAGSLYTTNTWDYPTYILIMLAGLVLPYLARRRFGGGSRLRWLVPLGVQAAMLVVWSFLSFAFFHLTFKSLVGGQAADVPQNLANVPVLGWVLQKLGSLVVLNTWDKGIVGFLVIFGIFLVGILGWLLHEGIGDARGAADSQASRRPWLVFGAVFVFLLLGAVVLRFPMLAFALPLAILCFMLVWRSPERTERNLVLVMVGLASLIAFAIEIIYLRDVFNDRQNTIFKFYYQIWVLYAVGAAYGVWRVLNALWSRRQVSRAVEVAPRSAGKAVSAAWAGVFALLVLSGLMYTVYGGLGRMSGRPGPIGLDGMAHFKNSAPGDYEALRWLKANATGAQRVLECCHDEYNVGNHVGRVSSYTGVPTLISWDGHEYQWRGGQPDVLSQLGSRRQTVTSLYTASDGMSAQQMLATLQANQVDYVFVGAVERGTPGAAGSFAEERLTPQAEALYKQVLAPVFTSGETVIYKVPPAAVPGGLTGDRR
ncbi:MAG TPA: DUF2298 domain-containing protein [Chloroflexia bacterium]|nr:DUF2298 domain-containing protein [Chloroflexia bacterium]